MEIKKLNNLFFDKYPQNKCPEIVYKQDRPHLFLIFPYKDNLFLCVPFRSNINHKCAYFFKNSKRSEKNKSGIDYSKTVIINNLDFVSSQIKVDVDEYNEIIKNSRHIKNKLLRYINEYIKSFKFHSTKNYHIEKYKYTTLKYFHDLLEIGSSENIK